MRLSNNQQALFTLLSAGLWEQDARLLQFGEINYQEVFQLAQEQSVVGIIAAGLEHIVDTVPPKIDVLSFVSSTIQLEQKNAAMNVFIAHLMKQLNTAGISSVLVKGQGIAQCYERPLWRSCGDIDLLLDAENYDKAKVFLTPIADRVDEEIVKRKHLGITLHPWEIELHGTRHSELSKIVDSELDLIQQDTLGNRNVRVWQNGATTIYLPTPDNDVIFVFVHILQHFFKGGIGLRQICDWCRLMWTYRSEINVALLEQRLTRMGLMTEWKAFAALAVSHLAMPEAAMPIYSSGRKWRKKANRIVNFVLETGNFGHNRDTSYMRKRAYLIRKSVSLWRLTYDTLTRFLIFPLDSIRMWGRMLVKGVKVVAKGK